MAKGLIKHAYIVSPGYELDDGAIVIENGKIAQILEPGTPYPTDTDWVYDAEGELVMPGFIDVHTHGAAGVDVCDADDPTAIEATSATRTTPPPSRRSPRPSSRKAAPPGAPPPSPSPRKTWRRPSATSPNTARTRSTPRSSASTSKAPSSTPPAAAPRTPPSCASPTSRK